MYRNLRLFLIKNISILGRKYKIKDFLYLLITAATTKAFIESICKSKKKFPNADTLHLKIKENNNSWLIACFDDFVDRMIRSLPRDIYRIPVELAIDETYEAYYLPVDDCLVCSKFWIYFCLF